MSNFFKLPLPTLKDVENKPQLVKYLTSIVTKTIKVFDGLNTGLIKKDSDGMLVTDSSSDYITQAQLEAATALEHNPITIDTATQTFITLTGQNITLNTELSNTIWAGPSSGSAAVPTFRSLVAADIPVPASGSITNSMLANMAADTIKSNPTNSIAAPSDLSITENTFPARASTGDIAAKSITDFALTILDDADAATVRATIGVAAYTLPVATASVLGGVKPDGTSILNTAGVISATAASVGADASGAATSAVATHAALTTGVHGLAITAGQTLTVTTGGTLGSAAYTASTAYDASGAAAARQAAYTNLTTIGSLADAAGYLLNNGAGTFSYSVPGSSTIAAWLVATADQDRSSTSFIDATNLGFSVAANKTYNFRFILRVRTSDYSTQCKFQFTGPASTTAIQIRYLAAAVDGSTTYQKTSYGFSQSESFNYDFSVHSAVFSIEGVLVNGANAGTVQLQFARTGATGTTTIGNGSCGTYVQLN